MKFRTALAIVILLTTGISFGADYAVGHEKPESEPEVESQAGKAQALVILGIKQGLLMAEAQCKARGFFIVIHPNLTVNRILCFPAGTQVDTTPAARIKKVIRF